MMRYAVWTVLVSGVVTAFWLYGTWHQMDPKARSIGREPTPIRRLHPHVRQDIEEQVGDFA